ncbi:MAG TPA: DUF58 domain-containing protein [Thermoanaerobaculia bacterium]|nr:DUF58 domain-containing protein [Thermoanaerobaculia bacterium]
MIPARRFFGALGLVALVIAAAVITPGLARLVLPLDGILVALLLVDYARARRVVLSASRARPPLLVQGVASEIAVRVFNPGPRAATAVLREGLDPAIAGEPIRVRADLVPGRETIWRYQVVPRRRGDHAFAPFSARVLGPWRLAWAQRDLLPAEPARVYPQVRWSGAAGRLLALAQRRELGLAPLSTRGIGTEPYGVRAYLPGDPPGKIHWRATARHGKLITREETWERGARLLVLLDCARGMASREAEEKTSKLDAALSAALALARVAAARGDRVTTLAFSNRIERLVRTPAGARGSSILYERLFDVEAHMVEPAYDIAASEAARLEPRRANVVLFTSLVDLVSAEVLRVALLELSIRHRVLLVNLEDADLARLALGEPASTREVFAKVSALEILLANRRLAVKLRRAGIRILTTPADRLALDTLNAYLGMAMDLRRGSTRARLLAS